MPTAYETAVAALTGLVGWWKLNEASGTTATDSAGTVGDATYSGTGVTYNQISLLPGDSTNSSVLLDGTNGRLTRAHVSALDMTDAISMLAWIQPANVSTDMSILFKPSFDWGLYIRGASVNGGVVRQEAKTVASTSYTLVSGAPFFIVGTYDKNGSAPQSKLYVNGVLIASTTATTVMTASSTTFEIGSWLNSQKFSGYMQHVAICNAAITQATVQNLYVIGAKAATETTGLSMQVYPFSRVVLASNGSAVRRRFWNNSDRPIWLGLGTAAVKNVGPYLKARTGYFETTSFTGDVYAIHSGYLGSKTLTMLEE